MVTSLVAPGFTVTWVPPPNSPEPSLASIVYEPGASEIEKAPFSSKRSVTRL